MDDIIFWPVSQGTLILAGVLALSVAYLIRSIVRMVLLDATMMISMISAFCTVVGMSVVMQRMIKSFGSLSQQLRDFSFKKVH